MESLSLSADHIEYIHPILVVEANLWEIKETDISPLKYYRLIFQKMFEEEIWIDVVNIEYLNEYLNKTKEYDKFFKEKKFKLNKI